MSQQVTVATVQQYKANVELLLQQMGSKFRGAVTTDTYVGKAGKAVEQLGPVVAVKRTTRHSDTPLIDTPHDARWVFPVDYEWADLIDNQDKLRMIVDLQSPYARNGAAAIKRAVDDEIIASFFNTSLTGENGTTTTTHSGGGGQSIAVGGTGMTIAKLKTAKRHLMAAEVDVDVEKLWCAISARQHEDLLNETLAVNLDYTNRPVLVDGRITAFMGFNFIDSERLAVDGSSDRRCPAWATSGMHLGIWEDLFTDISPRVDKGLSMQVYARTTVGATRLEEEKVVEIICDEP